MQKQLALWCILAIGALAQTTIVGSAATAGALNTPATNVPTGTVIAQWTDGASPSPFTVRTLGNTNCGYLAGGGVSNLGPTTTLPYLGRTYSFEQWYTATTAGTNNCGSSQSIDLNNSWVDAGGYGSAGYTWFSCKWKVYFASPTGAGGKNVQRKLCWLGMGQDQGNSPTSQVILTSDDDGVKGIGIRLAYQDSSGGQATSWGLGGDYNEIPNPNPGATNGTTLLPYDTWITLELVVKRKTTGLLNSEMYVYKDGTLVYKKTNWSPDATTTCPKPQGGGGTQICQAFPVNDYISTGFVWAYFGTQANRIGNNPTDINERRYHADITICAGGRCP